EASVDSVAALDTGSDVGGDGGADSGVPQPPAATHLELYVAASVLGASDSNDGLSPTYVSGTRGPWRTLGKAASTAVAGDNVHVNSGNYVEDVVVAHSGTVTSPIRFVAGVGQTPTVRSVEI